MKIRKGTLVVIKDNWDDAGKIGLALGSAVLVGERWVPVLWRGAEDPDFHREDGLEILKVHLQGIKR